MLHAAALSSPPVRPAGAAAVSYPDPAGAPSGAWATPPCGPGEGKRPRLVAASTCSRGSAKSESSRMGLDEATYDAERYEASMPVVGRTQELQQLRKFFLQHVSGHHGGQLYVCGMPGTGKTHCVQVIVSGMRLWLADCDAERRVKLVVLKANTFNGALEPTWRAIAEGFELKNCSSAAAIQKSLCTSQENLHVLVMDEIDLLHKEALATLFKISLPSSSLVILGIANMIDAASKLLKDLANPPPELPFSPYDFQTLVAIVSEHVDSALFNTDALTKPLELGARKVAANSGDARAVIDLARRALALAEGKLVDASHIMQALQQGSINSESKKRMSTVQTDLPSQAKIALVALYLVARASQSPYVRALDVKKKLGDIKRDWMLNVEGKFEELMDVLTSSDLVHAKTVKKEQYLCCKMPQNDLLQALDDQLRQIANGAQAPRLFGTVNMYKPTSA